MWLSDSRSRLSSRFQCYPSNSGACDNFKSRYCPLHSWVNNLYVLLAIGIARLTSSRTPEFLHLRVTKLSCPLFDFQVHVLTLCHKYVLLWFCCSFCISVLYLFSTALVESFLLCLTVHWMVYLFHQVISPQLFGYLQTLRDVKVWFCQNHKVQVQTAYLFLVQPWLPIFTLASATYRQ